MLFVVSLLPVAIYIAWVWSIDRFALVSARLLAHEAGLDYPLNNERRESILAKYKEYQHLSEALGKTARITIAPLLKFYPADRKALSDLIAECRT